jgi:signal transduction histidine kinase
VGEIPAGLSGRMGVLSLLERQKDPDALTAAARALVADLDSGRWPISAEAYKELSRRARPFLTGAESTDPPAAALAKGVVSLWEEWKRAGAGLQPDRRSVATPLGPYLVVWRVSENSLAGFAADGVLLTGQWLNELKLEEHGTQLVLTDTAGARVLGDAPTDARGRSVPQMARPWNVQAFSNGSEDELGFPRSLLWTGMAVLAVLILTGGWFVSHAITRELEVARLQSEFVSVVSHEFRTPLTALCQLSELLQRGRMATDEDRRQCYDFLHHESHRLRRLVESLLDFGRLESGKMQFRFEHLDVGVLLRQAAADFIQGQQPPSHRLEVETASGSHVVRADRETLRCVFWNLFENAVKYSPGCDTVWVALEKNKGRVEIAIRDQGVGIPAGEQRQIFEKFVRGSAARASQIRGTGIGLAAARQIVRAHGGDITLESEPGRGSTFRVVLPLENGTGNGSDNGMAKSGTQHPRVGRGVVDCK